MIKRAAQSSLPTIFGEFQIIVYHTAGNLEQVALLSKKQPANQQKKSCSPLVRLHSQCLTGDGFRSLKCDCHNQLEKSLKIIGQKGGILIYLSQEGRGIGLTEKIRAYALQEKGMDTVEANQALGLPADKRDYHYAAEILQDLGIKKIRLLSNNPDKLQQLKKYGIEVEKMLPLQTKPNKKNKEYLMTKKNKMGHKLSNV